MVTRCMYVLEPHPTYADVDRWYFPFRMLVDWLCGATRYLRKERVLTTHGTLDELDFNTPLTMTQSQEVGWCYQFYRTVYLKKIP
jgi:hypothetical protein